MLDSTAMPSYLLLLAGASGIAVGVGAVSIADGPAELELSQLTVGRVSVNDELGGVLALSAKQGGTAALQVLFREFGRNFPIARLDVRTRALAASVTGRSSELLFGLEVFLNLARRDRLIGLDQKAFAATGTLDVEGNVGSVEGVPTKIAAAIDCDLAAGSFVFYPRANDDEVTPNLRQRCTARGLVLRPVDQLEEALIALGVTVNGRWVGTPYRSLEAFERQHSRIFFGRQGEIHQLVEQLAARAAAGRPGALIIGGSGSGKSSFCMAGVLPALERLSPSLEHAVWRPRDAIPASRSETINEADIARSVLANWRLRDVKNGAGFNIAMSLPDTATLPTLSSALAEDALASSRHIWIIDQFEELFTLGFSPEAQIAFARFLSDLQARGVWVIATLRNEFFNRYQDLHDGDIAVLTEVFGRDGQFDLVRMGRDALRRVIVLPAELAGLKFETRGSDNSRLDDVILAEAMKIDDVLPLLEFTLQLLYDGLARTERPGNATTEQPRQLTFAAYEAIGGIKGAIGRIVEPTFAALDAETQKALPGLLDSLAVPAADGQRETARPAVLKQRPTDSPENKLIDALVGIRVLVSDDGGHSGAGAQVRVAHEALFTHWPEAAAILQESRQTRLIIEDFRQRAEAWDKEGRPDDGLLTSSRDHENAKAIHIDMNPDYGNFLLHLFLDQSIKRQRRQTKFRLAVISAVVMSLTITAVWALAGQQRANDVLNRFFAVRANEEFASGKFDGASRYILAGLSISTRNSSEFRDILSRILFTTKITDAPIVIQNGVPSPNGRTYALLSNGTLKVTDRSGKLLLKHTFVIAPSKWRSSQFQINYDVDSTHLAVTQIIENITPKGINIYSANRTRKVDVFNLHDHTVDYGEEFVDSSYNERGQTVYSPDLSRSFDGLALWTRADNSFRRFPILGCSTVSYKFSPDSENLAVGCIDGSVDLWNVRTTSRIATVGDKMSGGFASGLNPVAIDSKTKIIASAITDSQLQVWQVQSRIAERFDLGARRLISAIMFSPDDKYIVAGNEAGDIFVFEISSKRVVNRLYGHTALISAIGFESPTRIWSQDVKGVFRMWSNALNETSSTIPDIIDIEQHTPRLAISGNGEILASAIGAQISLFHIYNGKKIRTVELAQPPTNPIIPIHAIGLSQNGGFFIISRQTEKGMFDSAIEIYDSNTGFRLSRLLRGNSDDTHYTLSISVDGRRFATGDISGDEVTINDIKTGEIIHRLKYSNVWAVEFAPDGNHVAIGADGGLIHIVRLSDLYKVSVLNTESNSVTALAYSKDGTYLAAIVKEPENGFSQSVVILNLISRRIVMTRNFAGPLYNGYFALGFSDDGQHLALTAQTNRTDLIDIRYLTADLDRLVFDACHLLLARADRRFDEIDVQSDPLLRAQWQPVDRDVCEDVRH